MCSDSALIESIISGYLTALKEDARFPRPDYSIDGQTVSRAQWRESLIGQIKQLQGLAQNIEPFELRGSTL